MPVAAPAGFARVVTVALFREVTETSPPLAATEALESIDASLVLLMISIATAPATPMSVAPAPETATARNTFIGLGSSIPALTVTPSALIVEAPIVASAEALTRFKATAAPTPTSAVPASVPQAFAESPLTTLAGSPVSLLALTIKGPLAVMVRPPGIVASAVLETMFTATAAATVTEPSEVEAAGVLASLLVLPALTLLPFESVTLLSLSAKSRAWAFSPSTELGSAVSEPEAASLPSAGPESVSPDSWVLVGPPLALAMDETTLAADPSASNVTPPPVAVIERLVVAVVWSVAKANAIDAPNEAVLPAAASAPTAVDV